MDRSDPPSDGRRDNTAAKVAWIGRTILVLLQAWQAFDLTDAESKG